MASTTPSKAPHPILEAIDWLEEVSVMADELVDACEDLDVALMVLGRVTDAIRTLRQIESVIDARCIELRGTGGRGEIIPVPGGGLYKVSGGDTKDVYDNDRLRGAIVSASVRKLDAQRIITTGGETIEASAAIENLVHTLLTLAGAGGESFASWRSGGARALGIDLAAYRSRTTTNLRGRIENRRPG